MVDERRAYDTQRNTHSADATLAALAGRQHGVVSRAQLLEVGFTKDSLRRREDRRRLLRLYDGVFAVGHAALTADSRRLAAVMACGPDALLSHRSAAVLWKLLPSSPQFEVTAPQGHRARAGVLVHRSRALASEDRAVVRAIPVTSLARTLVDLADVLDEERLAEAVHEAEVQRRFDLRALTAAVERVPGRRGRHRLNRVLVAYQPEPRFTRSRAERRLLALFERHGLPTPEVNLWIGEYEVDAYWPDARLAVEVDGGQAHHTRRAFHQDRRRDRFLAARGIQVVRVTWPDLEDEARLARELRAIRRARAGGGRAAGSPPAPACA